MLAIVILAAGQSSRMRGQDKLLEQVAQKPLLAVMAQRALATGLAIYVCLPNDTGARHRMLAALDVTLIAVPDAPLGMSHSLRAGIRALPPQISAAMILPADMPELTSDDLATMAQAYLDAPIGHILRGATADGRAGHPVIFPRSYFAEILALTGDTGARSVIGANASQVLQVLLPNQHALTDLDTPESWTQWRATQST